MPDNGYKLALLRLPDQGHEGFRGSLGEPTPKRFLCPSRLDDLIARGDSLGGFVVARLLQCDRVAEALTLSMSVMICAPSVGWSPEISMAKVRFCTSGTTGTSSV